MRTIILAMALLIIASAALADVPRTISYQGRLTDDLGSPLTGTYDITFTIYSDTNKIKIIWTEDHASVPVEEGLFNVTLGANNPIGNAVFNGSTRWLAMAVDGGTESPSTRIGSVANALRAFRSDTAAYAHATAADGEAGWVVSDSVLYTRNRLGVARGGSNNVMWGDNPFGNVNLGIACTTGTPSAQDTYISIAGGYGNKARSWYSTVSGGERNTVWGDHGTVGGGFGNDATSRAGTIAGGYGNQADGEFSAIGGGYDNSVPDTGGFVGGGWQNRCEGTMSTIGGGYYNDTYDGYHSTVGGGYSNSAQFEFSTVGGGYGNRAIGDYTCVPGGYQSYAQAAHAFAAGTAGRANHSGSFVWADRQFNGINPVGFETTDTNQFLVRAVGGVGINTNDPVAAMHVEPRSDPTIWATTLHVGGDDPSLSWTVGEKLKLVQFNGSSWYSRGVFDENGRLGLGTSSPEAQVHVYSSSASRSAFMWMESDGILSWSECGLRIETPQNRWHFRMDDNTNNNIPDGALSLRTQEGNQEVVTFHKNGLVSINRTDASYRLDVNGGIRCVALVETSDERLKQDIVTIENALEKVSLVRGVSFAWNEEVEAETGRQLGVVAQEVEEVFPEIVSTDNDGFKGVDYTKLTAVLIEAVKELKAENQELRKRIESLEDKD